VEASKDNTVKLNTSTISLEEMKHKRVTIPIGTILHTKMWYYIGDTGSITAVQDDNITQPNSTHANTEPGPEPETILKYDVYSQTKETSKTHTTTQTVKAQFKDSQIQTHKETVDRGCITNISMEPNMDQIAKTTQTVEPITHSICTQSHMEMTDKETCMILSTSETSSQAVPIVNNIATSTDPIKISMILNDTELTMWDTTNP
jgi:hypothetical protein